MDGTQFFCSDSITCARCLRRKKRVAKKEEDAYLEDEYLDSNPDNPITFSHKVVQLAIMHPNMKQVIPLMPEEVCNEDGYLKQDCEMNVAQRLIPRVRQDHPRLGLIFGGDDLFSKQAVISMEDRERVFQ